MLKRIVITLFIILTLNFFLPRLMKADPFLFFSEDETGLSLEYSEKELIKYRKYYELDKPLFVQYINYIIKSFKGDFGYSIIYNMEVSRILKSRILWTVSVVIFSLIISVIMGVIFGSVSAWYKNSLLDKLLYSLNIIFTQIPHFVTASFILLLFSTVFRGFLPTAGGSSPFVNPSFSITFIKDIINHSILPILTLAVIRIPGFYLIMRNSMINEIDKKYVIVAKAKGLKDLRIILKHCLINSFNPLLTRILMSMGHLIGGAVIIESIYQYPGVGLLIRDSVFTRDYPLIQAIFFIMALMVMVFSQLTEFLYNKKV